MSYNETIDYLFGLQWHGIKLGLDNPRLLLERLGNPHEGGVRFAHAAGTNGKGSTCAMLRCMLSSSGLHAGLFSSPHIVSFTERIGIDGIQVTEREVIELAQEVMAKAEGMKPTFFEVVTAMAFMYFQNGKADCAVMETGMGGRLDATNVITPEVTIITPIGLDHAEFLGDTLEAVAHEKAGIIKPGVPVICARQEPAAMEVIARRATELGSQVYTEGIDFSADNIRCNQSGVTFDYVSDDNSSKGQLRDISVPLRGEYQARNASLAVRALEVMTGNIDEIVIKKGLSGVSWPGRLELVADNPPVYVDGAHNPAAARSVARELMREASLQAGMTLVIGVMSDKDAEGIIKPLLPLASSVIFTRAAYGRASEPEALTSIAKSLGFENPISESASVAEAIKDAVKIGQPVLVTGSFYSAGEAMEALGIKSVLGTLRESAPLRGGA